MNRTQSRSFFLSLIGTILVFGSSMLFFQVSQRPTAASSYLSAKFQTQETPKRRLSLRYDPPPVVKLSRTSKVDSDNFPNDFVVDVKNTGNKPIYYMFLYLTLPEVEVGGAKWAFELEYGNHALFEINKTSSPDDESLKPGETHTFKLEADVLKNYAKFMQELETMRGETIQITKVQLEVYVINFGDGTGYFAGKPFSRQSNQESSIQNNTHSFSPSSTSYPNTSSSVKSLVLQLASFSDSFISLNNKASPMIQVGANVQRLSSPTIDCDWFFLFTQNIPGCDPGDPSKVCPVRFFDRSHTPQPLYSYGALDYVINTSPGCSFIFGSCWNARFTPGCVEPCPSPMQTPHYICGTDGTCTQVNSCGQSTGGCSADGQLCACGSGYDRPYLKCVLKADGTGQCEYSTDNKCGISSCTEGASCEAPCPVDQYRNYWKCGLLNKQCSRSEDMSCGNDHPDCARSNGTEGCNCGPLDENCGSSPNQPTSPEFPAACHVPNFCLFGTVNGGCKPGYRKPQNSTCCCLQSPIIIDINNNGYSLTNVANGVNFDFNNTGIKEPISWTAAGTDEAFLVLDRNGNGVIDSGRELFGSVTPQPTSYTPNGFLALGVFDGAGNGGNNNGVIDNNDAVFSQLRLWQDSNHDGVSQARPYTLTSKADFDGDGKADFAVWRGAESNWLIIKSSNGTLSTTSWGSSNSPYNDVPVLGDYDGDGKTDIAVWRPGEGNWYIKRSSDNNVQTVAWGAGYSPYNDVPVPGDYDGDGKTDVAVWRPNEGHWYIKRSSDNNVQTVVLGAGYSPYNDVPVPGDYDGDGKTDAAVWRPNEGNWYVKRSSNGTNLIKQLGISTDVPVPGDYDGDGKTDIAVWRGTDSNWYIWRSSNDTLQTTTWGTPNAPQYDVPVSGDYDGDGKTDVAVWRTSEGRWYVLRSSNGTYLVQQHGQNGDTPTRKYAVMNNELFTLPSLGVLSIQLSYTEESTADAYGNLFRYRSSASFVGGSQRPIWDIILQQ